MRKTLIVNADDFGLTPGVNRAIAYTHRCGIVTSASLLANGPFFTQAVALSREAPALGIGVHLNLTQGAPLLPGSELGSLVDQRGRLYRSPSALWLAIVSGRVRMREIESELRAQVQRVVDAGIRPTHLDSHMHVHVLPAIAGIVIRMSQELGIPAVRCPIDQPTGTFLSRRRGTASLWMRIRRRAIATSIGCFARRLRRRLDAAGLRYPEWFYGIAQTGLLDSEELKAVLDSLRDGTSELCCHPGYWDDELVQAGGQLISERETELCALTSQEALSLVQTRGIHLATYSKLAGAPPLSSARAPTL